MTSERIDNSARYILARKVETVKEEGERGSGGRWRRQAKSRRIVGIKPTTSEFDIGRSLNLTRPTMQEMQEAEGYKGWAEVGKCYSRVLVIRSTEYNS